MYVHFRKHIQLYPLFTICFMPSILEWSNVLCRRIVIYFNVKKTSKYFYTKIKEFVAKESILKEQLATNKFLIQLDL